MCTCTCITLRTKTLTYTSKQYWIKKIIRYIVKVPYAFRTNNGFKFSKVLNTFTESQQMLFNAYLCSLKFHSLCLFSAIKTFDNDDILKESQSLKERKT